MFSNQQSCQVGLPKVSIGDFMTIYGLLFEKKSPFLIQIINYRLIIGFSIKTLALKCHK